MFPFSRFGTFFFIILAASNVLIFIADILFSLFAGGPRPDHDLLISAGVFILFADRFFSPGSK